ncbi:NQR2/RnfD/RnfE family subunit of NADH-ubiquinone oxidoreductase [Scopulibacillus darangshiensis]|uniref:NQR2/RnfD/RnfE family subunit of NADH-ubiquinone oxidoreductase n=1 Tax=Scopulibacillus darangshiensis TaxID=442528 RepID=A0A4V2SLS0_9BACL|nr:RnfABCDGE type electron transport complex subunit D [Scopulibacillus darangshiensis]TCP24476.1 NQR2/RnfD/RnfE family subunit of NADH-ubiquinone oxidoreductase [Scopulibacillus darangshiensis]
MNKRKKALRRFALTITIFNILGHTVLGFEQSIAQIFVSLGTAYSLEILFETMKSIISKRKPNFSGSFINFMDFLLPAHISGLAISMLIYANDEWLPFIFATAVAICSKEILRAPHKKGSKHFLNPSNTGIVVILLLCPRVGIAPPYHFTEYVDGFWDWFIPALILSSGVMLNAKLTNKMPLILAWAGGFIIQALIRYQFLPYEHLATLYPITGLALILFTFYMITDPGTTPFKTKSQICFGLSCAFVYGVLMLFNVVFGFFFSLVIVCSVRGLYMYYLAIIHTMSQKVSYQKGLVKEAR